MNLGIPFERMLAWDHWGNGQALASAEAMPDPPAKAAYLVAHLLGAQVAWMQRMTKGTDPEDWERWEKLDIPATRKVWAEEVPPQWAAFLADPVLSAPDRSFHYRNFLGDEYDARVEDALLQLMFHGSYHRGQVASAIRAAGGTPAVTDYIRALRSGAIS